MRAIPRGEALLNFFAGDVETKNKFLEPPDYAFAILNKGQAPFSTAWGLKEK